MGFHVCRMLDAAKATGARAVAVMVDSEGGEVPAGLAIVRALRRFSKDVGPTVAVVSRRAASMASAVAISADYALMDPFATFFVHNASGGEAWRNARSFRSD